MPETGEHGPSITARYVGHGNYRVDGLVLSRPGWWNVALVIDSRAGIDSVAFKRDPSSSPLDCRHVFVRDPDGRAAMTLAIVEEVSRFVLDWQECGNDARLKRPPRGTSSAVTKGRERA